MERFNLKKRIGSVLTFLSSLVIMSSSAIAAPDGPIKGIGEILYNTFGFLGEIDLSKAGFSSQETFYAKLLLWVVIFSVTYFGLKATIFKDKNNIAGTLGVIIALIAVMAMPSDMLRDIIQTYSIFVIFILLGLPILGIILIKKTLGESLEGSPKIYHTVSAIIFWLLLVVMSNMNTSIQKNYNLLNYDEWFGFAFVIIELLMLYHIIRIFVGHGSVGRGIGGPTLGDDVNRIKNIFGGKTDKDLNDIEKDTNIIGAASGAERNIDRVINRVLNKMRKTHGDFAHDLDVLTENLKILFSQPSDQRQTKEVLEDIEKLIGDAGEGLLLDDEINKLDLRLKKWNTLISLEVDKLNAATNNFIGDESTLISSLKKKGHDSARIRNVIESRKNQISILIKDWEKEQSEFISGMHSRLIEIAKRSQQITGKYKTIETTLKTLKTQVASGNIRDAYNLSERIIAYTQEIDADLIEFKRFHDGLLAINIRERLDTRKIVRQIKEEVGKIKQGLKKA